jgi:hypothetical protein
MQLSMQQRLVGIGAAIMLIALSALGQSIFKFEGEDITLWLSTPVGGVTVKSPLIAIQGDKYSLFVTKSPFPAVSKDEGQLNGLAVKMLGEMKKQKGADISEEHISGWTIGSTKVASNEAIMKDTDGIHKVGFLFGRIGSSIYQLQLVTSETNLVFKDLVVKFQEADLSKGESR